MQSPPETTPLPLARIIFVGAIVPALCALVDQWFMTRTVGSWGRPVESAQLLTVLVFQVGLLGVLCARLVEPSWLRWVIYGWCQALIFLHAASLFEAGMLSQSLVAAQLGLITVWAILAMGRWIISLSVVLILTILLCRGESFVVQTAVLVLICGVLRSQRFRLARSASSPVAPPAVATSGGAAAPPGLAQFGVRDLLIWTSALAVLLAVARGGQWRLLTEGILYAIVIVAALWAALGEGPAWLRWPLLTLFSLAAGLVLAAVDWSGLNFFPSKPPLWSFKRWQYLWDYQWSFLASFCLAGGLFAAALLIFRTLGYRLCREQTTRVANRIGA